MCWWCFQKRTPDEAEELITKISQNYEDWVIAEPTPTPAPAPTPTSRKRGVIELDNEGMREAKRDLKENGIKAEDVKNLPPIEDLCKSNPPPSVKVNSLQYFNADDVPYGKPPDQCLD